MSALKQFYYFTKRLGLRNAIKAMTSDSRDVITMTSDRVKHPVHIRIPPSSDLYVYEQVLVENDYDFTGADDVKVIIDAGANNGLSSVLFANMFPNAMILAIEPDAGNYKMVTLNAKPYLNIIPIHAALWSSVGTVRLSDPSENEWAYRTSDTGQGIDVDTVTVSSLIEQYGIDRISIFKSDIEGAEKEIFSNCSEWIDRVDSLIVELHDWIQAGCSRAFWTNVPPYLQEWVQGENVYLSNGMIRGSV